MADALKVEPAVTTAAAANAIAIFRIMMFTPLVARCTPAVTKAGSCHRLASRFSLSARSRCLPNVSASAVSARRTSTARAQRSIATETEIIKLLMRQFLTNKSVFEDRLYDRIAGSNPSQRSEVPRHGE